MPSTHNLCLRKKYKNVAGYAPSAPLDHEVRMDRKDEVTKKKKRYAKHLLGMAAVLSVFLFEAVKLYLLTCHIKFLVESHC